MRKNIVEVSEYFKGRGEVSFAPACRSLLTTRPKSAEQDNEKAPKLALEPRILDRMADELARAGLVGEGRAAKLAYLVLTSRFLERPLCAVIKAQSSAGKSYLVEQVIKLFPAAAYHYMTSFSPMALVHTKEDLRHRVLVIAEAAGFKKGDSALLLRSLISEGRIHHETVQQTKSGMQPLVLDKEGPTGLLVTTTAPRLEAELETRMLSIPINDSTEQTRAILQATGARWDGGGSVVAVDAKPWHELHKWLTRAEHKVAIPFAAALTELIPPTAVRMRRDIDFLLRLVAAHALLHQARRKRDEGCVVATVEDYEAIHELVADLISQGVGASVPATIREVVEAVQQLGRGEVGHSKKAIADKIGKHPTTVGDHVDRAVSAGYLHNLETRPSRPALLLLGDPMPEEQQVLPKPETLAAYLARRES
jgi:hypothetical protein